MWQSHLWPCSACLGTRRRHAAVTLEALQQMSWQSQTLCGSFSSLILPTLACVRVCAEAPGVRVRKGRRWGELAGPFRNRGAPECGCAKAGSGGAGMALPAHTCACRLRWPPAALPVRS
jgi:hypothetical protein